MNDFEYIISFQKSIDNLLFFTLFFAQGEFMPQKKEKIIILQSVLATIYSIQQKYVFEKLLYDLHLYLTNKMDDGINLTELFYQDITNKNSGIKKSDIIKLLNTLQKLDEILE